MASIFRWLQNEFEFLNVAIEHTGIGGKCVAERLLAEMQTGGKEGRHTEHLGYLLAEMQFLQRAYPDCEW